MRWDLGEKQKLIEILGKIMKFELMLVFPWVCGKINPFSHGYRGGSKAFESKIGLKAFESR
jgi:hypothetical protein